MLKMGIINNTNNFHNLCYDYIIFFFILMNVHSVISCSCDSSLVGQFCTVNEMEVCDVNLESSPLPPGPPRDLSIRHFVTNGNNGFNLSFYPPDDGSVTYLKGFQIKLLHTEGEFMNMAECYKVDIVHKLVMEGSAKPKIFLDCFQGLPGSRSYFIQVTSLPLPVSGPWKTQEGFYQINWHTGVPERDPGSWQPSYFSVILNTNHFGVTFNLAPPEFAFQTYEVEIYTCKHNCNSPLDQRRVNSTLVHIDPIELYNVTLKKTQVYIDGISGLHFLSVRGCRLKRSGQDCAWSRTFRTRAFQVPGHSEVGDKGAPEHKPEIEPLVPSKSSVLSGDVITLQEQTRARLPSQRGGWNSWPLLLAVSTLICFASGMGLLFIKKQKKNQKKTTNTIAVEDGKNSEQSKTLIDSRTVDSVLAEGPVVLLIYSRDSEQHLSRVEGFSNVLRMNGCNILEWGQENALDVATYSKHLIDISDMIVFIHSREAYEHINRSISDHHGARGHISDFYNLFQSVAVNDYINKIINIKFDETSGDHVILSLVKRSRCFSIPRDFNDFIKNFKLYCVDFNAVEDQVSCRASIVNQAETSKFSESDIDESQRHSKYSDDSYDSGLGSPVTPSSELPLIDSVMLPAQRFHSQFVFKQHLSDSSDEPAGSNTSSAYNNNIVLTTTDKHMGDTITSYHSFPNNTNVLQRKDSVISLSFMPPKITTDTDSISVYSGELSEFYERLLKVNEVG